MSDTYQRLLDDWVYNIPRKLETRRTELVDLLSSEDEKVKQDAEAELLLLLDWMEPPLKPTSRESRQVAAEEKLAMAGLPLTLARAASRPTGRKSGRPRTNGRRAIEALTLLYRTNMTWREIATQVRGRCEHWCSVCMDTERRMARVGQMTRCVKCKSTIRSEAKKRQVCDDCVAALRSAVGELEKYLSLRDLLPSLPARRDL